MKAGQETCGLACIVDVETTAGRTPELIELALILFSFRRDTGDIVDILDAYTGLREPTVAIHWAARRVDHISAEMCRGQYLDRPRCEAILGRAEFLVAHQATFDRPYVEGAFEAAKDKAWRCSLSEVVWPFDSASLAALLEAHGLPHQCHRAADDAWGLLDLLSRHDDDGRCYFAGLLGGRGPQGHRLAKFTARELTLPAFIDSLPVNNLGRRKARVLAAAFGPRLVGLSSLETTTACNWSLCPSFEELKAVPEIGPHMAADLAKLLSEEWGRHEIQQRLAGGVRLVAEPELPPLLEGKTFVFTGDLAAHERPEAQDLVERLGGRAVSTVSKKVDFVVAGEGAGEKLCKARDLGLTILDEQGFLDLVTVRTKGGSS